MTKEELISVCQEIVDRLSKKIEEPPVEYQFYNSFTHDYNVRSIPGLLKIPYVDLATALIYPATDSDNLNQVSEATQSFKSVLEDLSYKDLHHMNELFMSFIKAGDGHILDRLFRYPNALEARGKLLKLLRGHSDEAVSKENYDIVSSTFDKLLLKNGQPGWDILKLVRYYRNLSDSMRNIIAIICILKETKEKNLDYTTKEYYEEYQTKDVLRICEAINMTKKMLDDDFKKYKSKVSHEISIYKRFLRDIDSAFKKDEIINYEAIVHDIDDEELKCEFLKLVYEHNKKEYDKVEALNDNLTRNSIANYLIVLKNNNIKKDEVDLEKLMKNSCEDLDKMLKILNAIIGDKKTVLKIVEFSNIENVNYFKELKSRGILSTGAFMKYPFIFDSDSEYRKTLDKNIEVLNNYEVDFSLFNKFSDVLIENNNLEDNMFLLETYGLLDNLNDTKKMRFLMRTDLVDVLDKVIELGYEDFLNDGLDLLNEKNWDRIYVLKSMGLKPETKEELLKYLRDDKFFVSDDKLGSYIENATTLCGDLCLSYDADIEKIVKDNNKSDNSLSFDGVIISKNRVARNLVSKNFDVNDFFKAIITDSILSMDEIETIKSSLKNKVYKIGE